MTSRISWLVKVSLISVNVMSLLNSPAAALLPVFGDAAIARTPLQSAQQLNWRPAPNIGVPGRRQGGGTR